jgi:hypothetical protein
MQPSEITILVEASWFMQTNVWQNNKCWRPKKWHMFVLCALYQRSAPGLPISLRVDLPTNWHTSTTTKLQDTIIRRYCQQFGFHEGFPKRTIVLRWSNLRTSSLILLVTWLSMYWKKQIETEDWSLSSGSSEFFRYRFLINKDYSLNPTIILYSFES